MIDLKFFVPGIAKPAGSKRAFMRPGMRFPVVIDDCADSKNWKNQVRLFASQVLPAGFSLIEGPVRVVFTFYRQRPKGHFNSKGELNTAGNRLPYPLSKPDVLKLSRAVEDALTGVVWGDDSQIVDEHLFKVWTVDRPGVEIQVERMSEPQEPQEFELMKGKL